MINKSNVTVELRYRGPVDDVANQTKHQGFVDFYKNSFKIFIYTFL